MLYVKFFFFSSSFCFTSTDIKQKNLIFFLSLRTSSYCCLHVYCTTYVISNHKRPFKHNKERRYKKKFSAHIYVVVDSNVRRMKEREKEERNKIKELKKRPSFQLMGFIADNNISCRCICMYGTYLHTYISIYTCVCVLSFITYIISSLKLFLILSICRFYLIKFIKQYNYDA